MDATSHPELPWLARPMTELTRLSVPIAVSMLSYSTMTLVDTYFVGRLGAEQLAGVGLGGTIAFALISYGFGAMRGGKTLVSQAVGAGKQSEAGAYLGAALLTSVAFGLFTILAQWPVGVWLARVAASPAQGDFFATYLLIRSLGAPSAMAANALREVRYGVGDSRSPMVATLVSNVANFALGWLFIFPLHGGVAGAAWAAVVAQTIDVLVLAVYQHRVGWGVLAMRRAHVVSLLRIGVPTGVQFLLEMGSFTLLAVMIASMSAAQMAAHQITLQLIAFSFLPAVAIGEGVAVLVGQAIGAVRDDLVPVLFRLAAKLVAAYTGLCTLVIVIFAVPIVRVFTADEETRAVAIAILHVSGIFLIVDGVNLVIRAVLRGTGDVVFPAWLGIVTSWGLTPPIAWLLGFHYHMGAFGGWLGLTFDVFIGSFAQWLRLRSGGWKPHAARTRASVMETASAT